MQTKTKPRKIAAPKPVKLCVRPKSAAFANLKAWLQAWGIDAVPYAEGKDFYLDVAMPHYWNAERRRLFARILVTHADQNQ